MRKNTKRSFKRIPIINLNIQENISLKKYNTFGIDVNAKHFISISSICELKQLLQQEKSFFILSGGSNILLTKDINHLVVHINTKGICTDKEDDNFVYLTVNAGENWHQFVLWCIENNYGGIENLSLIPGNVGTCPIQNIGAYGAEVKDVITKVDVVEVSTEKLISFSNSDCKFRYRNSIFKSEAKEKYIIVSVSFRLTKNNHTLNTSYGAIESELFDRNILTPGIKDISDAIIAIRQSKLPDPNDIGNSGSFFKNPVISKSHFTQLKDQYSVIPNYPVPVEKIKIPAGWLIEQSGFKGKRFGDVGIHEKQALILVNYGNATGKEIYELAQRIQKIVQQKFNINLEIEVTIV